MDIIQNPSGPSGPTHSPGPIPMHVDDNPTTPMQSLDGAGMVKIAAAADTALTEGLQSVLDQLAEALQLRGDTQKTALNAVANYIKALAKSADAVQAGVLNSVLTDLYNVIQTNATYTQTIADGIVQHLAMANATTATPAVSVAGFSASAATAPQAFPGPTQLPAPLAVSAATSGGKAWVAGINVRNCHVSIEYTTAYTTQRVGDEQLLGPFNTEQEARSAAAAFVATLNCSPSGPTGATGPTGQLGSHDIPINPTLPIGNIGVSGSGGERDRPAGAICPAPVVNCPAPIINVMPCQPGGGGGGVLPTGPTGPTTPSGPTLPTQPIPPGGGGGGGLGIQWPGPGTAATVPATAIGQGCSELALLARIGSANWCEAINDTVGKLRTMGDLFIGAMRIGAIQFDNVSRTPPSWYADTIGQLPFGIGAAFNSLWSAGASIWNFATGQVKETVNCTLAIVRAVSCSDPALAIGLTVLRSALQALQNFRIGTDAGLWATLDIRVKWDQAEAAVDYLIKYACPYVIPSEGEAAHAWYGGWITEQQFDCWMGMSGRDPSVFKQVTESNRPRPATSMRQVFLWRLRNVSNDSNIQFTDADYKASLIRDGEDAAYQRMMYAIRYNTYGLREIKQLLDTGQATDDDVYNAFRDMGFADDKATALKKMEKVIYARRHEAEIVGATPSVLSRLYQVGQVTDAAVADRMKDLGYSKEDADRLILISSAEIKARDAAHFRSQAIASLTAQTKDAYMQGLVTVDAAKQSLESLGALSQSATALVDGWTLETNIQARKEVAAAIKKGWESGFISVRAAVNALRNNGISAERANQIVSLWQLQLTYDQKMLNQGEVLRMVSEGYIDAEAAAIRFHNMGVQPNEAQLLITEALGRLNKATDAAMARQDASRKKAIKDAETLRKQAEAASKQAVAALRAKMPLSVLNTALKDGLISEADYRQRMHDMQYDDGETDMLVKEIQYVKPGKPHVVKAAVDHAIADARKETPVSLLDRGLKTGLISVEAYVTRLGVMGYDPGIISLKVDEICSQKGAGCVATDGPDDAQIPTAEPDSGDGTPVP